MKNIDDNLWDILRTVRFDEVWTGMWVNKKKRKFQWKKYKKGNSHIDFVQNKRSSGNLAKSGNQHERPEQTTKQLIELRCLYSGE